MNETNYGFVFNNITINEIDGIFTGKSSYIMSKKLVFIITIHPRHKASNVLIQSNQ
jgi:hypothetical protein